MDLNKPLALPSFGKKKNAPTPAQKAKGFSPSLPRVDLTPPAVRERVAARKARRVPIALVGVAVLGVSGLFVGGLSERANVQDQLDDLKVAQSSLQSDLAVYAPVTNLATQTNSLTSTVSSQTGNEVLHGQVLGAFVAAVGSVGEVASLGLTTGPNASGCTSTDPFEATPLAGCITFTVNSSMGAAGASQLIAGLTSSAIFVDPFIPSVGASSDGKAALTGTVGVSTAAYGMAQGAQEPDQGSEGGE